MRKRTTRAAVFAFGGAAALAAGAWSSSPDSPATKVVATTVGAPFELKVSGNTTLGPSANGLRNDKGTIKGSPVVPMVMHAVKDADTTWIVVFAAELTTPDLPKAHFSYYGASRTIPTHVAQTVRVSPSSRFPDADSSRANPTTDAGATLGRVLFYDRRLSANDGVACASCHHQSMGFGDSARFSRGVGGITKRHSMALANVKFSAVTGLFWDLRAKSLEEQVLKPIQDSIEMGLSLPDLIKKLQATDFYAPLYTAAFGTPEITTERTARALAQFLRSMVSASAPFDAQQIPAGRNVFMSSGCSGCHGSATQISVPAINSGLDAEPADSGAGRARFRPPSLRNIAVRPPYMHDGRFRTLDEVIDFYSSGVAFTPSLDARLRAGQGARRLNLSDEDRVALLAFLNSLTDSAFLSAPEFSDPFRKKQ